MTSHDNVTDIDDAYIAAIWHSALNAYDHDGEGERDDDAAIADLGQSLATLRKQLDDAREALNGYRAAVSFISADSWDGCSDCINILKAARCADMTEAMTINETAEHLKRIRLHYDPAALRALPVSDGWEDIAREALRVISEECDVYEIDRAIRVANEALAALGPLPAPPSE